MLFFDVKLSRLQAWYELQSCSLLQSSESKGLIQDAMSRDFSIITSVFLRNWSHLKAGRAAQSFVEPH
jgi:hypothetical protein